MDGMWFERNRLRGIVELACGSQMTIGAVWGKGTRYGNLGLWKLEVTRLGYRLEEW